MPAQLPMALGPLSIRKIATIWLYMCTSLRSFGPCTASCCQNWLCTAWASWHCSLGRNVPHLIHHHLRPPMLKLWFLLQSPSKTNSHHYWDLLASQSSLVTMHYTQAPLCSSNAQGHSFECDFWSLGCVVGLLNVCLMSHLGQQEVHVIHSPTSISHCNHPF